MLYAFVRLAFAPFTRALPPRSPSPRIPRASRRAPTTARSVTIEQGVRVYRPVPPTQHLIINPDGTTPLQLNIGNGSFTPKSQAAATDR